MTAREAKHQVMLVEWKDRVIACRSSGQAVRTWCKEQGISSKTYYNWEREVLRVASEQLAVQDLGPHFAELPAPQAYVEPQCGEAKLAARLRMGDAMLELYEGAGAGLAAALCKVLSRAE